MADFHSTGMGRKFFEHTMPSIAKSLKAISEKLDKPTLTDEQGNCLGDVLQIARAHYAMMENAGGDAPEILEDWWYAINVVQKEIVDPWLDSCFDFGD